MKINNVKLACTVIASASALYAWYSYHVSIAQNKLDKFFRIESSDPAYLAELPKLNKFDNAILKVCGDWGSKPTKKDLEKLLDNSDYEDYVNGIYKQLDKQVIRPNADLKTFKSELIDVWFNNRGFVHIFCGEPDGYKQWTGLGGMHFIGRYVEAQEKGWAGAIWDSKVCDKNEISYPVYTIGVRYKNTKGEIKEKCPGGFDYLHAEDIFVKATKAWKDFEKSGAKKEGSCLYRTSDKYQSVLQVDNYSILTFFSVLSAKLDECGSGVGTNLKEAETQDTVKRRSV